jgi:hypothetical protein
MKIKTLFLTCLLLGIGLSQLSSQNANSTDTKTYQGWFMSTYYTPVYCNGQLVDYLEGGSIKVHFVVHYKDGKYKWETDQLKGAVTSVTGEVFTISELDKYYFTDHWYVTWHFNLRGDWGTHYIGTVTYSYFTGETTMGKAVCPGQ